MRADTHALAGLLAGLIVFKFFPEFYVIPLAVFAAIMPDFDLAFKIFGMNPLALIIPHRGPTHSLLFVFSTSLIMAYLINSAVGLAFFLGGLSHILLDSLNPKGVPMLWPIPYRTRGRMKYSLVNDIILSGGLVLASVVVWII